MCTGFWWGNLRERDHCGDPDVDGRIILSKIGLCLGSFGCFCNFVFQTDWLGKRRKGICDSGR